jgi:site-specific recombinase XerC
LSDWCADLAARGNTAQHVTEAERLARRVIEKTKAKRLPDLTPSTVQTAIGKLRDGGLSLRTANKLLWAIRSLTRWAQRDGRLSADPLAGCPHSIRPPTDATSADP